VDLAIGVSFVLALALVIAMMCLQGHRSSEAENQGELTLAEGLVYWQVLVWCICVVYYLFRFMTLGTAINEKHASTSTLMTEQINLSLRMLRKPQKKAELIVANNVLKLATKLLKELEAPRKVSGISLSPMLFHVTRIVVLSAFSAVVSDSLGVKLKLFKLQKAF
jgi:hypothetical protein